MRLLREGAEEDSRMDARQAGALGGISGATQDRRELLGEKVLLMDLKITPRPSQTYRFHQPWTGNGRERTQPPSQDQRIQIVSQANGIMGPQKIEHLLRLVGSWLFIGTADLF